MLASTETVPSAIQTGLYFDPLTFERSSLPTVSPGQRALKKHKVLPHPNPRTKKPYAPYSAPPSRLATIETRASSANSGSRTSSPRPSSRESRKAGGPDLPPTPPAHSRTTSTSSHSAVPSSPIYVGSPSKSIASVPVRSPETPPNQRIPPTPDVTPPQAARRPTAFRPSLADRIPSKATTADSRADSFKTARENPYSSEEDEKLTPKMRPRATSVRTFQSTVRASVTLYQKSSQNIGLGLGLESDDNLTPRTKQEFFKFDGKWGSESDKDVEQEWDNNLNRNVVVRKRQAHPKANSINGRNSEIIEDVTATPTNASKALRHMPLQERVQMLASPPKDSADRGKRWTAPSTSDSSISTDVRRSSGMSSKSTVSTVVEAILVDAPPQRPKTLRHVRKQTALRESTSDISPSSSAADSIGLDEAIKRSRARNRPDGARTDSLASSGTVNSLASRKARREVWKSGGIPVIVIPDRKASMKSMGTPSLRSTSSRRSQRSNSLSSVALLNQSKAKDWTPLFDRPSRRGRPMSEYDGSLPGDQRTIDYPPVVPMRTSSLSAPTSRNASRSASLAGSRAGSRTGSLTAESLKAHNTFQEQQTALPLAKVTVERVPLVEYIPAESDHSNQKQLQPAPSVESHRDAHDHRLLVDHNGDPFFGKRLTTHNTPFSQASVDTNGTHSAAEVSEAMAVNLYPHQNKSVLMVDHTSSKITDSNALQRELSAGTDETEKPPVLNKPQIMTSSPDGGPVTPPQPQFSMDDVDSPLRNPRAPPEPPAIKFIPATPSGLTPAAEKMKMLGNYFEDVEKRPSLVKRAFSLRKSSGNTSQRPGFLSRTLSLSRNIRKDTAENPELEKEKEVVLRQYPTADDPPPDEARLHPFWRPASSHFDVENDEDWVYDISDDVDQVYRYPPVDNRPRPPNRSLSQRVKHTFAILPIAKEEHYTAADTHGPERRTIKRTPSGNLRVMRHRDSYSSLRWGRPTSPSSQRRSQSQSGTDPGRPSTASDRPGRRVWLEKRVDAGGRRFFPGWQDKFGIPNLQRRLSEHRRQKRSEALRQKISGPCEVRDGVGEVIKRNSYRGPSYQNPSGMNVDAMERPI